jgi:opine dehydrogenase
MSMRTIAVLGAGNGGRAIAAYLASMGHTVRLYNRNLQKLSTLVQNREVFTTGVLECKGRLDLVTDSIAEAVRGVQDIFVVTTADAHRALATELAPLLESKQMILLNPGRTGGALEFREVLRHCRCQADILIAEAQSLVYACRIKNETCVQIFGAKEYVPIAALPCKDVSSILSRLNHYYRCFVADDHVLHTSLENIGAIFHPPIVLFNAAAIERGQQFKFYQDVTSRIANFLIQLDRERIAVGAAYGCSLTSVESWVSKAYPNIPIPDGTLCEKLRTNPAYSEIQGPLSLESRYIYEDLATGLVPLVHLGRVASIDTPLMRAIVDLGGALLNRNFWNEGRSLDNMGLADMTVKEIIEFVTR